VGAGGWDLGNDPHRYALLCGGKGGPLAGEPGPYDEYVVGWHEAGSYRREFRSGSRDSLNPSHCTGACAEGQLERSAKRRIAASESRIPSATVAKSTFSARSFGQW